MNKIKSIFTKLLVFASFLIFLTIFNNSSVFADVGSLPSKGYMDAPAAGSTIKGDIKVSGWYLDGSDVSKIEVLVDGKIIGQAQYGSTRLDAQKAFPEYQNANSGYQFTLKTTNISNGQHIISVRETSKKGTVSNLTGKNVSVQNQSLSTSQSLTTRGTFDSPINGSIVKGNTLVRGWFLDSNGVSKIEVLVDGKIMGPAQYGISRLDVQRVYPQYQNANSGYQYTLNTTNLSNGQHTLTVRETSKNGAIVNLPSRTVNVQNLSLPIRGTLDSPLNGSTVNGDSLVRGWLLDPNGVSKIEVLVDGKIIGQAQYGISRPDVQKIFPAYNNSNAGYQYTLATSNLTNGLHSLSVRETSKNGTVLNLSSKTVNVQNQSLPVRGTLESPLNGSTVKGDSLVRGWFLDPNGVSKIDVLVDGKIIGQAQYGISRPDVQKIFPPYQNANSGYQYTLNTSNLNNGQHSVSVRETSNNGTSKTLDSKTVNVQNPSLLVRGSFDEPANGSTVNGDSLVRGWVLDPNGVSKIEVLVDGTIVGQAEYGISRLDVQSGYPEYQNANSGYQYTLNTRNLNNGQHSITVRETSTNATTKTFDSKLINVQNSPAKGSIDDPKSDTVIKDDALIRGWLLDGSGVSKVEVYVDGKLMGEAAYGSSRPDVLSAFPQYQNANSEYQFTLNTLQFADGQHSLTIKETGNNGSTYSINQQITIGNGNLYLLEDLMKPSNITATDIVNFFNLKSPNSPLKNYAQSFIDAQNKYGVNAQYLVAHAIWETGWGGSDLRTYKHNLYGYGAYDMCPFTCGYYFPTGPDSINNVAYQVRVDYLNENGSYYSSTYGPTLTGMNVRYATDQNWKNGIANLMASIKPYDYSYYSHVKELPITGSVPPSYGRDIPAGQAYPTDTVINFPSGISATVNASSLTFRSLPYVSPSTVISTLGQYKTVTVLGFNTDVKYDPSSSGNYAYHWYRVSVDGRTGWLYGQFLDIANLLQANLNSGMTLPIKNNPFDSAGLITSVPNGTYLKPVLSNGIPVMNNGWYNVYLPNSTNTGWVYGMYVNRIVH
ncbi:Ig-like domain-containing protein [Neobacillus terrae]|uniref:Ig-like domain-containing protein n=1 Tax=Neobacillus terrae TaxID=3034837 RepID=UPI00140B91CD|nr:Ig-like domain-containing protein [Neobacillus terrae]NHM30023.1 glucosaminidase domain-containing protein [Neobacillus terrae]